jgi:protein TonB
MKASRLLPLLVVAMAVPLAAQEGPSQKAPPPAPSQTPAPSAAAAKSSPDEDASKVTRIHISGNVAATRLIKRVEPGYPPLALQVNIQGTVRLHAIIGADGRVRQLNVISGHPLLVQSTLDAVHKWIYEPTLLNGKPVEVDTAIDVVYSLTGKPSVYSAPAIDPHLKADIERLFEIMEIHEQLTNATAEIATSARPALAKMLPETPNKNSILDEYIQALTNIAKSPELTDALIEIYAKHFNDDDIKVLTRFYSTPTGQRLKDAMPEVTTESRQAGERIAREMLPGVLQNLCGKYPELRGKAIFCPADKPAPSTSDGATANPH